MRPLPGSVSDSGGKRASAGSIPPCETSGIFGDGIGEILETLQKIIDDIINIIALYLVPTVAAFPHLYI